MKLFYFLLLTLFNVILSRLRNLLSQFNYSLILFHLKLWYQSSSVLIGCWSFWTANNSSWSSFYTEIINWFLNFISIRHISFQRFYLYFITFIQFYLFNWFLWLLNLYCLICICNWNGLIFAWYNRFTRSCCSCGDLIFN